MNWFCMYVNHHICLFISQQTTFVVEEVKQIIQEVWL